MARQPVTARWLTGGVLGWLIFVAALILLTRGIISIATHDGENFAPVTVGDISVEPNPVVIGDAAILHNGICSTHPETLQALVYLRLEEASVEGILNAGRVINLYEGRPDLVDGQRRTDIRPGCTPDQFNIPAVPPNIPLGHWVLKVTITVMPPSGSSPQRIVEESDPFEVRAALSPQN